MKIGSGSYYIIFTTKNLHSIESNEAFEKEYRKAIATNHRFDQIGRASCRERV